jgi:hypothetical protein
VRFFAVREATDLLEQIEEALFHGTIDGKHGLIVRPKEYDPLPVGCIRNYVRAEAPKGTEMTKDRAKNKPKLTDAERHKRFVETAKKVEASEDLEDFDRAFSELDVKTSRDRPRPASPSSRANDRS